MASDDFSGDVGRPKSLRCEGLSDRLFVAVEDHYGPAWSYRSVAADLGCSENSLHRWLGDKGDPSAEMLRRIAVGLDVSPAWLLGVVSGPIRRREQT